MTLNEVIEYLQTGEFNEVSSLDAIAVLTSTAAALETLEGEKEGMQSEISKLSDTNMQLFMMLADGEEDTPDESSEEDDLDKFFDEMLREE